MKQSMYVDSIDNVSMVEGVMRFDLMLMAPPEADAKTPQLQEVCAVATSVFGFVRIYDQLTQVMQRLESQGVIKRQDKQDNSKV